jgi:hypothetical protein
MNDKFLYQLREEPTPEFASSLRQRISRHSGSEFLSNRKAGTTIKSFFSVKRFALAFAALLLVLALALTISPAARAAISKIIETITMNGVTVWVSEDIPVLQGESESYAELWTPLSPAELSTRHPDLARLPAWVPDGYALQERAALFGSMIQPEKPYAALFEWKNAQGGIIQIRVSKGVCPNGQLWESGAPRSDCAYGAYFNVGAENPPEALMINDQTALLLPGLQILMNLADPQQEWNPYRGRYDNRDPQASLLIFETDGMRFEIATKAQDISKEELIRLAESIP